jgi:hypothetical protein
MPECQKAKMFFAPGSGKPGDVSEEGRLPVDESGGSISYGVASVPDICGYLVGTGGESVSVA